MAGATAIIQKCSKCDGILDTLDTKAKDLWCRKCRAEYQREYQDRRYEEAKAEGFDAGVKACQLYLLQQFSKYPIGMFSGMDIINYIRRAEMPKLNPASDVGSSKVNGDIPLR